jgi:hypothetical protein
MLKSCSMRMTARLALLQPDASGKALLFEAPRAGSAGGAPAPGSPRHRLVAPTDATADVVASHLSLSNTLLASAVQQMQARFISDVGVYMQVGARSEGGGALAHGRGRPKHRPRSGHFDTCLSERRQTPPHGPPCPRPARRACAPRATCSRAPPSWSPPSSSCPSCRPAARRRSGRYTTRRRRRASSPTSRTRCWCALDRALDRRRCAPPAPAPVCCLSAAPLTPPLTPHLALPSTPSPPSPLGLHRRRHSDAAEQAHRPRRGAVRHGCQGQRPPQCVDAARRHRPVVARGDVARRRRANQLERRFVVVRGARRWRRAWHRDRRRAVEPAVQNRQRPAAQHRRDAAGAAAADPQQEPRRRAAQRGAGAVGVRVPRPRRLRRRV